MTKLTFENAFLGAKIIKNKEELFVYKINKKTLYYGKLDYHAVLTRWENKSAQTTWKSLMDDISAYNTDYEGLYLSDNQTETETVKKASDFKKEKKYLSSYAEKEVKKLYDRFVAKKGSWAHQVEVSKEMFKIVQIKDKEVLLSVDSMFVFYNIDTKKYNYWREINCPSSEKNQIPWPSGVS